MWSLTMGGLSQCGSLREPSPFIHLHYPPTPRSLPSFSRQTLLLCPDSRRKLNSICIHCTFTRTTTMADDKTLSEQILSSADALQKWKAMEPITDEMKSLVGQYRETIDGIGTFFGVFCFVWKIYSSMEKSKARPSSKPWCSRSRVPVCCALYLPSC